MEDKDLTIKLKDNPFESTFTTSTSSGQLKESIKDYVFYGSASLSSLVMMLSPVTKLIDWSIGTDFYPHLENNSECFLYSYMAATLVQGSLTLYLIVKPEIIK